MFKWEPIEKLNAQPDEIKKKLGTILIGRKSTTNDIVYLSYWMGHRWANDNIEPTHFMLIEALPE